MTNDELEKLIAEKFTALPRKRLFLGGNKKAVWLRIQSYIDNQSGRKNAGFIANFFLQYPRMSRLALTSLAVVVALITLNEGVEAAKGSLPGEALYPVKIASEKVEVALATNDTKKAQVLTLHAKTRLEEVTKLVEENKEPEIVTKTLQALKTATEEVVAISQERPELREPAVELATEQTKVLATVESKVEVAEVKQVVKEVISLSQESIVKLLGKQNKEKVEGETSQSSTTTPSVSPNDKDSAKSKQLPSQKKSDGVILSPIQLDGVIRDDGEDASLP